jgi:protease-4
VDELSARLARARDDAGVRAIILRINSPGGTVTASDVMYREVRRFADETGKPVVASLGEVAASGGYYLALSADRIVAEPTSITGSIGVIIPTVNVSAGLERIGIHSRSLVSGKNKDVANPLEPEREGHYALLQGMVDEFYAGFRSRVVERRGPRRPLSAGDAHATTLDTSRLDDLTDGRIVTGRQAVEAGLADELGGVREAFEAAKRLAGMKGAQLVKYYREDASVPRSAYAPTATAPSAGTEINLIQIRAESLMGLAGVEGGGAYYLWLPPG